MSTLFIRKVRNYNDLMKGFLITPFLVYNNTSKQNLIIAFVEDCLLL